MNNQAPPSSSSLAMSLWHDHDSCQEQELPVLSWSQLLLGGSLINDFQKKKLVDVGWEDQMVAYNASPTVVLESEYVYGSKEIQQLAEAAARASWSSLSPGSCVTTNFGGSNMLDFSSGKAAEKRHLDRPVLLDHSSECNSKETGGAAKKIKVAAPYSSTFKVRKEKLGDRIAVLHQLVSPFGKTDTASVLLEAIGYIRFLQNQIEALSSPYLGSCGGADSTRQHGVKGRNCIFPEDPGQVDGGGGELKDLRSRGLCLVPLSSMCTPHVGGDAGADQYWAAASLAAGFL